MWSRAVAIVAVCAAVISLVAVLALIAFRGGPGAIGGAEWVQVVGFIGILMSVLGGVVQGWMLQSKLNGHVGTHVSEARVDQTAVMIAAQHLVGQQEAAQSEPSAPQAPAQEDPPHGH